MASAALANPNTVFSTEDVLSQSAHGRINNFSMSSSSNFSTTSSIVSTESHSTSQNTSSHKSPSSVISFSSKTSKSGSDLSKNLMALDLSSPFVPVKSSASSVASSVRRRDVIKRNAAPNVGSSSDFYLVKPVAQQPKQTKQTAADVAAAAAAAAGVGMAPGDMVIHTTQRSQWIVPPAVNDPNPQGGEVQPIITSNANNNVIIEGDLSNALVLHSSSKQRVPVDPSEVCRGGSSGSDPPGEAPSMRPFMDNLHHQQQVLGDRRYKCIQWMDPKAIIPREDIDYDVLGHYEQLVGMDSDECASETIPTEPPRIRIATISSGYKKANFFVREDLDQRIYFHDLEDAVSYMARRGYSRMRKEQEMEWMKLLGKAHQVVKVGPTKKKQRYRKGRLVLIMCKTVVDEPVYEKTRSSDTSTAASTHTSIGRSIRGGFKSYSEKFLAEQEEEKRFLLTGEAPRLLLMNGPADPEPAKLLQITNGEDSTAADDKSRSTASSKKSSNASRSSEVRMVNYRGGVRYFTPDNLKSDDEESEEEEEEESTVNDSDTEESGSYYSNDETSAQSSSNSELSSINRQSQGVRMASNTGPSKNTLNNRRAPTPYDMSGGNDSETSSHISIDP